MTLALILVAAGSGARLGRGDDEPKALVEIGGRTLLAHAVERTAGVGFDRTVVVHAPGHAGAYAADTPADAVLVEGGATRSASVAAGLAALQPEDDVVAIHDVARPFTPTAVIEATIAAIRDGAVAAAPALPVADTLKRTEDDRVVTTVDRAGLAAVQTPQTFVREVLDAAREWAAEPEDTDDLAVVERAIEAGVVTGAIRLVPGSLWAQKMTYPEDLVLGEMLASRAPSA